jgi:hypothetical protein
VGPFAGLGGFSPQKPATVQASPVIKDLQSMDDNAQMYQQLNSLDQQDADNSM